MAGRRASETHYHGHVDSAWQPNACTSRETFQVSLDSPDDVAKWLGAELRKAVGKPEMGLSDEWQVWVRLAREQQTITTGLQGGPTITAVPMPDGTCWCRSASLQPV